jgi:hypothetical protein
MGYKFLPQRLGINFFGTLNVGEPTLKEFMESLMASEIEVVIISGATQEILAPHLAKAGIEKDKHFKEIISIPSFLTNKNYKIEIRPDRTYFTHDDDVWWRSKGFICAEHRITAHIDSDSRYKEGFDVCATRFIHNDYRLVHLIRTCLDEDDYKDPTGPLLMAPALNGVFPC